MIIIIEGPDGAGKTTLANHLSAQTGYPIEHRSKPETAEEKLRMMQDYVDLSHTNRNVILDRCWYSEMVYGPVMRDQAYIDADNMLQLEQALNKHGAVIIYCTGPLEVLWNRCKARGEDYITSKDQFTAIYEGYEQLMQDKHILPVIRYEVKEMS